MQFRVESSAFNDAVKQMFELLNRESKILAITAKKDFVLLESGVSGTYVALQLPATVKQTGTIGVDLETMTRMRTPAKTLLVVSGSNQIKISSGSFATNLATRISSNKIRALRPSKMVALKGRLDIALVREGLQFMGFRPILLKPDETNVRVVSKRKKLYVVTNDDYRGAYYVAKSVGSGVNVVLPVTRFTKLIRFLPQDIADFGNTGNRFRVKTDNFDFQAPLIQGSTKLGDVIAHTRQQLQQKTQLSFVIAPHEFYNALENVVSVYKKDDEKEIELIIDDGKGTLELFTNTKRGKSRDSIKCSDISGRRGKTKLKVTDRIIVDIFGVLAKKFPMEAKFVFQSSRFVVECKGDFKVCYNLPLVQK